MKKLSLSFLLLVLLPSSSAAQLVHESCGTMDGYEQKEETVTCSDSSELATVEDWNERISVVVKCNGVPRKTAKAPKGFKISSASEGFGKAKICYFKKKE